MEFEQFKLEFDDGICSIIPRILHRYNKIDENFINSLEFNYVWFSDPLSFNDPYDCNLDLEFDNTPEEIRCFLKEVNEMPESAHLKLDKDAFETEVSKLIADPEIFYQRNKDQSLEEIKKIGICCFSESDSKLLMWSHYGDKHQGVCLTFDADKDKELFLVYPYCVEYPKKFPKYNWIRDKGNFKIRRFEFATKSLEWSYENEVRIIKDCLNSPFRGKVKFNKDALISIKFGYKSTEKDQLVVKELLKKIGGYDHVRFYLGKLKRLDFGIEYEEIFLDK